MSEMVDRVKQAIWENRADKRFPITVTNEMACAVIAAMRFPTDAMVEEGGHVMDGDDCYSVGKWAAVNVWQVMIDEALTN